MVKFDNSGYDDEKATAPVTASFGVFQAQIKEVLAPRKEEEIRMEKSKNNQDYYKARVVFAYKNEAGEEKEKSAFLNFGLWFPDEMRSFLEAIGMDTPEGRKSIMGDSNAIVGNRLQIIIAAAKSTYAKDEVFEGYKVTENAEGDKFLSNEIIAYAAKGEQVDFDMEAELALRKRFRDYVGSGNSSVDQPGFSSAPKKDPTDF